MKTTRINKGQYITSEGYFWICKTEKGWEVKDECTGELYYTAKTKKEALRECEYRLIEKS